jgi:hypothetical protein
MVGQLHPEYLKPRLSEIRSMVTVGPALLERFPRFSLYNSPYAAHEQGCAIDLYPHGNEAGWASNTERGGTTRESGDWRDASDDRLSAAPSPVSGEVVATRTVDAPPKPYAVEHDHLIVVDTGSHLARILHVEPAVEPGDEVAVGDSLGQMVRSGFFAPWVDNHIHLGFRDPDANPFRASGSLPVEIDPAVDVAGVPWDGRGTAVAAGDTYAILDAPDHPSPGEAFAGISADDEDGGGGMADSSGRRDGGGGTTDGSGRTTDGGGVLDGGLPHYDGGGVFGDLETDSVSLAGQQVGTANGRTVAWDDLTVRANGTPITGISLFFAWEALGAKLVCPEMDFEVGEAVEVAIERE